MAIVLSYPLSYGESFGPGGGALPGAGSRVGTSASGSSYATQSHVAVAVRAPSVWVQPAMPAELSAPIAEVMARDLVNQVLHVWPSSVGSSVPKTVAATSAAALATLSAVRTMNTASTGPADLRTNVGGNLTNVTNLQNGLARLSVQTTYVSPASVNAALSTGSVMLGALQSAVAALADWATTARARAVQTWQSDVDAAHNQFLRQQESDAADALDATRRATRDAEVAAEQTRIAAENAASNPSNPANEEQIAAATRDAEVAAENLRIARETQDAIDRETARAAGSGSGAGAGAGAGGGSGTGAGSGGDADSGSGGDGSGGGGDGTGAAPAISPVVVGGGALVAAFLAWRFLR